MNSTIFGIVISFFLLLFAPISLAQTQMIAERVMPEYASPGLVVIAFAKDDPRINDVMSRLGELALGQSLRPLRRVQLDIAIKAARVNPVVILVPDDEMKLRVLEDCDDVDDLCAYLDAGRISVEAVPHESVWVRDYGPMIRTTPNGPVVVHAPYHDERSEVAKRELLSEINSKRLALLRELDPQRKGDSGLDVALDRLRSGEGHSVDDEEEPPAVGENRSITTDKPRLAGASPSEPASETQSHLPSSSDDEPNKRAALSRGREPIVSTLQYYDELYAATEKDNMQRQLDEEAAPVIGISLLANPSARSEKVPVDIDGGNLLPMPDGKCITTRGLLIRNAGRQNELEQVLHNRYGCRETVYLYPLPGGVIEHVDMFLLPAGEERVFLASFSPSNDVLKPYWRQLNGGMSRLATEAAIAMSENEAILRQNGYSVIDVPSPLPREIPLSPGVFYPTLLNGLVQKGEDGKTQFILPTYDAYEPEVQAAALLAIRSSVGPAVDVETVEATSAAIEQGAVHCLTLLLPQQYTRWASGRSRLLRDQIFRDAQKLIRDQSEGLEGVWHVEGHDDDGGDVFSGTDPKIIFRQQRLRFQSGGESKAYDYRILTKNGETWTIVIDEDTKMRVVWKGPTKFDLVDEENHAITVVRK